MKIYEVVDHRDYTVLREGLVDQIKAFFQQKQEANRREYLGAIQSLVSIVKQDRGASVKLQQDTKLIRLLGKMGVTV